MLDFQPRVAINNVMFSKRINIWTYLINDCPEQLYLEMPVSLVLVDLTLKS